LDDLGAGRFQRILPDTTADPTGVTRVLMCSGKIYYELERERDRLRRQDVAIVRVEQLYPLRDNDILSALTRYPEEVPVFWVQEEPANMGAWPYLRSRFCAGDVFGKRPFAGVTRPDSSSPATGSANAHKKEQERLLTEAFGHVR
jgi:2-oxoglutarate dehydrogenase E1 component